MVFQLEDIRRSIQGDGDLKFSMNCKLKLEKILPPEQAYCASLSDLAEIFNDGDYLHSRLSDYLPRKKYIISKKGLANTFVMCNRVFLTICSYEAFMTKCYMQEHFSGSANRTWH